MDKKIAEMAYKEENEKNERYVETTGDNRRNQPKRKPPTKKGTYTNKRGGQYFKGNTKARPATKEQMIATADKLIDEGLV